MSTEDGQQIYLDRNGIMELAASVQTPGGPHILTQNMPAEMLSTMGMSEDMLSTLLANNSVVVAAEQQYEPNNTAAIGGESSVTAEHHLHIHTHQQPQQLLMQLQRQPADQSSNGVTLAAETNQTNATHTPILSTLEQPTKSDATGLHLMHHMDMDNGRANLEQSLAVIGVTQASVPTSLELPITITNPAIAHATLSTEMRTSASAAAVTVAETIVTSVAQPSQHQQHQLHQQHEYCDTPFLDTDGNVIVMIQAEDGGPQPIVHHHHHQDQHQHHHQQHMEMLIEETAQTDGEMVPMTPPLPDPDSVTTTITANNNARLDVVVGGNNNIHAFSSPSSDSSSEIPLQPTEILVIHGQTAADQTAAIAVQPFIIYDDDGNGNNVVHHHVHHGHSNVIMADDVEMDEHETAEVLEWQQHEHHQQHQHHHQLQQHQQHLGADLYLDDMDMQGDVSEVVEVVENGDTNDSTADVFAGVVDDAMLQDAMLYSGVVRR